jgi:hypothetical protein
MKLYLTNPERKISILSGSGSGLKIHVDPAPNAQFKI